MFNKTLSDTKELDGKNQSSMKVKGLNSHDSADNSGEEDQWTVVTGVKGPSLNAKLTDRKCLKQNINNSGQGNEHDNNDNWKCENRFYQLKGDQSSIDQSSVDQSSIGESKSELQVEDYSSESGISEIEKETMTQEGQASIKDEDIIANTLLKMAQEQEHLKEPLERQNVVENDPHFIDIRTVMKMFNKLQVQLSTKATENEGNETTRELRQYKRKTEILTGVVNQLGNMYTELEKKTEQLDLRTMHRSMVITGLSTDNKIAKCLEAVYSFIEDELLVQDIDIIDCFKLGIGCEKPIVFTVGSITQRAVIYQAMEAYRKYIQEVDKDAIPTVFINDYLPPEIKEKRRREREIYRGNEKDVTNKVPMEIGKTGLNVQGQKYTPVITVPDPTEVLNLTEKEIDKIYEMELKQGNKVQFQGSEFLAYVVPANTHITIQQAYMRLKLTHPRAKHISLAYTIPGMPRFRFEEYCDDKEIGAGKYIMNMIKRSQISNTAIFVIRYQFGNKIGPARFDNIERAVVNAFEMNAFNKFVNANQSIKSKQEMNNQPTYAGRGGMEQKGASIRGQNKRRIRGGRTNPRGIGRGQIDQELIQQADRHKRRRKESPTGNVSPHNTDTDTIFRFNAPQPVIGWKTKANGIEDWSLGSSWPTLQQSSNR